jgi:hypothetical protein
MDDLLRHVLTPHLGATRRRCGAYARALQYFERHVRQRHGGGLNPAAFGGGCSR